MVTGSTQTSENSFYSQINPIRDYRQICDLSQYRGIPSGWIMFLCDIRGSTKAIEAGKYKEVNFLGAACITAVTNQFKGTQIPYVFGGDGATLLLPASCSESVSYALGAVQRMAIDQYAMELRVALIPIDDLVAEGLSFKISKYALSSEISIALFSGDGFFEAEARVKNKGHYLLDRRYSDTAELADMEGLECRWESLPAKKGEIISVLVKAVPKDAQEAAKIYQELIEDIANVFGDKDSASPVSEEKLKFNLNPKKLNIEAKAKSKGIFERFYFVSIILLRTVIGFLLVLFKIKNKSADWGLYKTKVARHSDYWKFDDTLRFVFDVTPGQKSALIKNLEKQKNLGRIFYGTHSSNSALMTCLIFNRGGEHVHFIDGADGGYALAAVELKQSMKK